MIALEPWVAHAVRSNPGVWEYVCINIHEPGVHRVSTSEYLRLKESLAMGNRKVEAFTLELDFDASFPRLLTMPSSSSSIGHGLDFLSRHLSSTLFRDASTMQPLLDFLRMHNCEGQQVCNNQTARIVVFALINGYGYLLCVVARPSC